MGRPTFVYDGDCAFCTACARFIQRWIPSDAQVLPWQFADLDALGCSAAECAEAVQWIGGDGDRAAGPDAIARLLAGSTPPWRIVGRLLRFPPVRAAAWPAYRWVARNRHRMPGGTAACAVWAPEAGRSAARAGSAGRALTGGVGRSTRASAAPARNGDRRS